MPRTKSLHNFVIKSPPQCPGLVSYVCRHVHPCMPMYTLMCTHPTPLVQPPEQKTCVLFALWRAEGTQPSPFLCKARSWWFTGKGHSVQSNEQEANFNQELQNDLGTEGKAPRWYPRPSRRHQDEIRERSCPPIPPRRCCQPRAAVPLHLISPR